MLFIKRKFLRPENSTRDWRMGGIYLITLTSSLLVATLALAGLQSVRVQRRMVSNQADQANARLAAQAGLEYGYSFVQSSALWRVTVAIFNNVLVNLSNGSYRCNYDDPIDSSITDNAYDPIVITSEGRSGSAVQKLSMELQPDRLIYEACRNPIHAQGDVVFNSGTTTTNKWITSNNQMNRNNSATIYSDCAAKNGFNTATGFTGIRSTAGSWDREMPHTPSSSPSSSRVSSYYDSNSVVIAADDLPQGGEELISNPGIEVDTASWTKVGTCTLARNTSQKQSGTASMLISARSLATAGPVQDVTSKITSGATYNVSAWVRPTFNTQFNIRLVVVSSTGTTNFTSTTATVNANTWRQLGGTLTPTWTGTLTSIEYRIISNNVFNYYLDDVSLTESGLTAGARYIRRTLLSDGVNPYGSGTTDAEGIYEIDMGGEDLVIRDCRIRGTLLIKNANSLKVESSVNWEAVNPLYPVIITDGSLELANTNTNLSESTLGINFNPASTPYNGTSNTTTTDSYPSVLNGLVYSAGDILVSGNVTINGQMTAQGSINMSGTALTVNYPAGLLLNPPPGYRSTAPKMLIVPESFQYVE